MNRSFHLLWTVILMLGCSIAWAQDDEEQSATLPEPAADEARDAAMLPDAASNGLEVAAEATIRLMEDDEDVVTNDLQLPELPEEGAAGQRGLDTAAQAIADGEEFGRGMADDARNNAQDATEGRGRAEDLPVDVPGRPDDLPTPPIP